ncbi:MAG TPA: GNAT family N-acetyltransferase [Caulobacteraceae bacterium]|jgi:GNAT superfamily N-acetyltransferase|nr:GNAT family N-acetyltransferase [Caulobacteraceae bacterium]
MTLSLELRPQGSGAICHAILTTIGDWFGMPASNAEYEGLAESGPAIVALEDGQPVGLMLLKRHFDTALEVYFLGVAQDRHRRGVGRALMAYAERIARAEARPIMQVKTQGPSAGYEPYERTRRFYVALGYVGIEEMDVGWGPENPTLVMVKPVAP